MSITNITKRKAFFYDDKGEFIDSVSFSKTDKIIKFKGRAFNIFHKDITYTPFNRWYCDIHAYHYNINNPNPFNLTKKAEPILDAEAYNIQLETKVLRDLNEIGNNWLDKIDMKMIFGLLVVLGLAYWYFTKSPT